MIKEILTYPTDKDILTSKSIEVEEINDEIKNLIQDLKDTLNSTAGCGISAVQIGELKRICLIKINGQIKTLINPVITKTRGEVEFKEGCLSAPDIATTTKRAYEELERDNYIYTVAGKGSFVAKKNLELVKEENLKLIEEHFSKIIKLASINGLTKEDILNMLNVMYDEN